MASRLVAPSLRASGRTSTPSVLARRAFRSSARSLEAAQVAPIAVQRPVGAFRGGYVDPPCHNALRARDLGVCKKETAILRAQWRD